MNSFNHYAYGAVCQWLFESVAGFRPDPAHPAFARILFEPTVIPALAPVRAYHDATTGRIEAEWSLEGDRVTYVVTVPAGAEGEFIGAARYRDVAVDGKQVPTGTDGKARGLLAPGRHIVTFRISRTGG